MFVRSETTANPAVVRFLPGRAVLDSGSASFADPEQARRSPLAASLFEIEGVVGVLLESDGIAVSKAEAAEWHLLKPPILAAIMGHFMADLPVLLAEPPAGALSPLGAEVERLLDERIRPGLAEQGGEVLFRGLEDDVVSLEIGGSNFETSLFVLKVKIENTFRNYLPEVADVRFVEPSRERPGDADRPGLKSPEGIAIQELLDDEINPAIAAHGGYISLIDVEDDTAYIQLAGGCQGCGMADVTLKQGVEGAIIRAAPTITNILDVTDHAAGSDPYFQPSK